MSLMHKISKSLAIGSCALVLAGAGCATPKYSPTEKELILGYHSATNKMEYLGSCVEIVREKGYNPEKLSDKQIVEIGKETAKEISELVNALAGATSFR